MNLSFQPELDAQSGTARPTAETADASKSRMSASPARKAVVVHAGARDAYQVALALEEAGMLKTLVTDMFWPAGEAWADRLKRQLPQGVARKLHSRSAPGLPAARVTQRALSGIGGLLLDKAAFLPFGFRRWLTRTSDGYLGRVAGRIAKRSGSYLVSYSYYGFDSFRALGRADLLFQMHPHPSTVRRLLTEEMARHPESSASLQLEWELSLPQADFAHLVEETRMARCFLTASSFTRDSLVEHGANPASIRVVPYGVDLDRFHPVAKITPTAGSPLQLLFVGRINQRKGLRYLFEALQRLAPGTVELTICGRVLDSVDEWKQCNFAVHLRPSVSAEDLVKAYQQADLFVLPSLAEGFGQVLLESLACGLPILSTTRTAAPDLIEDGIQGFVVPAERADLLAERIAWAAEHRRELATMGIEARRRAELFTWARFRRGVAAAVAEFMAAETSAEGGL